MPRALTVEVGAGRIDLLGQRAAWLPDARRLLVADAHFGKAQAFRTLGVPVPAGTTAENLRRLDALIVEMRPREVVFLGDLLHARHGCAPATLEAVGAWRQQHGTVDMRLVRGNHDSRAGDPPQQWHIAVVDEPWLVDGWALCHHPQAVSGAYTLAGHDHPGVTIGSGADRLRLPCFHVSATCTVLPAFGEFTGLHAIRRRPGDRVVAVVDGHVRMLSA